MRPRSSYIALIVAGGMAISAGPALATNASARPKLVGTANLQHIIMIMQENRSFDEYFGTYPGANGLPTDGQGNFTSCVPDPQPGGCQKPWHNPSGVSPGGPHDRNAFIADVNGGAMDGFIREREQVLGPGSGAGGIMSYHDAREIPNYWTYAQNYVLQDRMFAADSSWSLPEHLSWVANWSAHCATADPFSCASGAPSQNAIGDIRGPLSYTDETYLLHKAGVSWGYFVTEGTEPDCLGGAVECTHVTQNAETPGYWNPLPAFTDVKADGQLRDVQSIDHFYKAAAAGTLPNVSWVQPNHFYSEHDGDVKDGQAFVTSIVNAVMASPDWATSAIFISWDEWGGFYDHVVPPQIDKFGYGLRVPGLVISPWAKPGYIDDQVLSHDAYNKLIEDVFLGGQRLDPKTDGRPDPRPTVREAVVPGDLLNDFNFTQTPLPPTPLPLYPKPGPASSVR